MAGQTVGYIRVSTLDQHTARQLDGIEVDRVFTDTASGKDSHRPQLDAMLGFVRDGDTVVVHSMDRLARNQAFLMSLVDSKTDVRFCDFPDIPTGAVGRFMLQQMAAVADPTEASAQPGAGDLPLPFRSYGRPDTVCAPARGGNHGPGLATRTRRCRGTRLRAAR